MADEFISERENQSLHAKEIINAIHTSQIYKDALKSMLISKEKEDDESASDSDEEPIQFKPHQPRFMTPLYHVTASSPCNDLLVIHIPSLMDVNLMALVDSGATQKNVSILMYEKSHFPHILLTNPFVFDSPMGV